MGPVNHLDWQLRSKIIGLKIRFVECAQNKIILKDDAIRNILEAPVAEGQKLSPEELKKQYHQNLKNATSKEEHISLKVNLVEN